MMQIIGLASKTRRTAGALCFVALLAPSLLGGTTSTPPIAVRPHAWTDVGSWKHTFGRCLPSDLVTGVRVGNGTNPSVELRCASLENTATGAPVFPGTRGASAWMQELEHQFTCPSDRALYQRMHFGDALGDTQFRCAELVLHDSGGHGGVRRLILGQTRWHDWIFWRNRTFECPSGYLITGHARHMLDVRYRCSTIVGTATS